MTRSLEDTLEITLDGDQCDQGALETAQATANNAGRSLARLLVKLHDMGLLTLQDLDTILENCNNSYYIYEYLKSHKETSNDH